MTDRDKLTALLDELFEEGLTMTLGYMADHLMKNGVTVQKNGRWEWSTKELYPKPLCSRCKYEPYRASNHQSDLPKYCPSCGARMDGDNNADNR